MGCVLWLVGRFLLSLRGGVSVIVPDSVTGLIQSSAPMVQGGKSFAGLFKSCPVETLPVSSVLSKKGGYEDLFMAAQIQENNVSNPSILSKKGGYVAVQVDPSAYKSRLEVCKFSLIGRIVLSSGEKPWKLVDLKAKL